MAESRETTSMSDHTDPSRSSDMSPGGGGGAREGKGKARAEGESEAAASEFSVVDDEACFVDGWEGKVGTLSQVTFSGRQTEHTHTGSTALDFISSLPDELSLYILLHLPLLSLLSAIEVSRVWHQLASDNLVWRDLFHRETRWRIRDDLGETTARLPSKQIQSLSASVSRRSSLVQRSKSVADAGVSKLGRKLSDIMSDLGGLSLTPLAVGADRRRIASVSWLPNIPNEEGAPFPPSSTSTPRRPASGVTASPFALAASDPSASPPRSRAHSPAAALSASTESLISTPGPLRRASSATIPPLGPVPSPSFKRVPLAPLFLDWPKLYRDRYLLERRWEKGAPVFRKLDGHRDSVYCLQFDDDKIITGSVRICRACPAKDLAAHILSL